MNSLPGLLLGLLLGLLIGGASALLPAQAAAAAPVDWREVPATAEGRQWWDAGSLRIDRDGRLSVLSRYRPAAAKEVAETAEGPEQTRPPVASLYVMQLDCDQQLFRDVSVNGLPRFRSEWQTVADDKLGASVIREACQAWSER
jgi:hypothetical protein